MSFTPWNSLGILGHSIFVLVKTCDLVLDVHLVFHVAAAIILDQHVMDFTANLTDPLMARCRSGDYSDLLVTILVLFRFCLLRVNCLNDDKGIQSELNDMTLQSELKDKGIWSCLLHSWMDDDD
ncbi:hypothetical protein ACJMK2_002105 [Sinanodonta woodiana]|uniref:Uncharacterized protein n=1 Tax=Sinanodonta woodiana TaxID=1069815 RepID=A0ABD3XXE7_SINWO